MDNVIAFPRRQGMDPRDHQQALAETYRAKGWTAELVEDGACDGAWIALEPAPADEDPWAAPRGFVVQRAEGRVTLIRYRDLTAFPFASVAEAVAAGVGGGLA